MLYFINSYKPDAESLKICVNRVKQLDKNATIAVINDGNNPVEVEDLPKGVSNMQTSYNRGGNLRGTECVLGQLSAMKQVLNFFGSEKYIVKLDCDTWLNSVEWLSLGRWAEEFDGNEPDLIVQERSEPFSISGDCYRLSRVAVDHCLKALNKRVEEANKHGVAREDLPEDVTICHLCSYGRLVCKHIPYYTGNHVGMQASLPSLRQTKAAVVHCGEPTVDHRRASRDFVLLRMRLMEHAMKSIEEAASVAESDSSESK